MPRLARLILVLGLAFGASGCGSDVSGNPDGSLTCTAAQTLCGAVCCTTATQTCSAAKTCVTKAGPDAGTTTCTASQTQCGTACCENATQVCDATTKCAAKPSCTASQTQCGTACCDNATQVCDATTKCAAKPSCTGSQTQCGTACCDNATQVCDATTKCAAKPSCTGSQTVCGTNCCDNATQTCNDTSKTCETKCTVSQTKCGADCCDNASQICDAATTKCVAKPNCGAGKTQCGSDCCTDATQYCDGTTNKCVTKPTCTGTQTQCGTACCENATQICDPDTTKCVAKPTCTGSQTQCGANCCDNATQICDTTKNTCAAKPNCTAGQTQCGVNCCTDATQTCNQATKQCETKTNCGTGKTQCGTDCCDNATQVCDAATTKCVAKPTCTGSQTQCGAACCDNATQYCDGATTKCVTKPNCTPSQTACGAVCCDNATQSCDATKGQCVTKPTCNTGETACGSNCCKDATEVCDPSTSKCVAKPTCGTGQTQCGTNCCVDATQTCNAATKSCDDKTVVCDPVAANPCPSGKGCYWIDANYEFECATAGTVALGATCTTDADCVPGAGCWPDATGLALVCTLYCDMKASPTICKTGDTCTDVYSTPDGKTGYCAPKPVIECDVLKQNCTDPLKACYPSGNGAETCQTAGTVAIGGDCTNITDCVKGGICLNDGICHAMCDPAATASTCTGTDACQNLGTAYTFGYCGPGCDPVKQNCGSGYGCYVGTSYYTPYECATAGTTAVGATCDPAATSPVCVPGSDCNPDGTGLNYKCEKYCAVGGTGTCTTPDTCSDLDGANGYCAPPPVVECDVLKQNCTDPTKACYPAGNHAMTCQTAGTLPVGDTTCTKITDCVKGAICLGDGYSGGQCYAICDTAKAGSCTTTDVCHDETGYGFGYCGPGCDPQTQNCNTGYACYVNYTNQDFECGTAGTGAVGTVCTAGTDCKLGTDCFQDASGLNTKCETYCPVGGTGCTGTDTCTDIGDGKNGYCAPPPTMECDVIKQNCTDAAKGCYPGSNGAMTCQTPGTVAFGDACAKILDCVKGGVCADDGSGTGNGVCDQMCDTAATPTTCPTPDVCTAMATAFGVCAAPPPPSCDPLKQDCVDTTTACYFDWTPYTYVCHAKGTGATGDTCYDDWECIPGDNCMGGNWDTCTPFCDPAVTPDTCPTGTACAAIHTAQPIVAGACQ